MLKRKYLLIILSAFLVSCETIPDFPEIYQCAFKESVGVYAFYCVNSETKEREKRLLNDPRMNGAQAVSAEDYKKITAWQTVTKDYIRKNCK